MTTVADRGGLDEVACGAVDLPAEVDAPGRASAMVEGGRRAAHHGNDKVVRLALVSLFAEGHLLI